MTGLIDTLLRADRDRVLFDSRQGPITAGAVRAAAARAAALLGDADAPVFLHTDSAGLFTAGLLAAALRGRRLVLPAHLQPAYLAEIGGAGGLILTDRGEDGVLAWSGAADAELPTDLAGDLSLTFFTSGSTGAPKPVDKRLSLLEVEADVLDGLWGGGEGRVRATVSHQHIYGLIYRVVWPLTTGRVSADEAVEWWEELVDRMDGADTLIASPAHLTRLPHNMDFRRIAPARIFSSGQLLTEPAAAACREAFGQAVIEVLGSTETGGVAWRQQTGPDTPWTPFPVVRIDWGDEEALLVSSPYISEPQPYALGDRGEALAGGLFRLKGRADRVEKVDGRRISLTRIEETLRALPLIDDLVALTLPERHGSLAAVAVLSAEGQALLAELGAFRLTRRLRNAVADTLEPIERPKHWRFETAIPVDTQGKRRLATLRTLFETAPARITLQDGLVYEVLASTGDTATLRVELQPQLVWFQGHFPDTPVMPGIAQVHAAVLLGRAVLGFSPTGGELSRCKFKGLARPGETLSLTLSADPGKGRLTFAWTRDGADISQGVVGGA